MIVFNDDFAAERDAYGWMLHVFSDGKDKDGNPKRTSKTLHYANLGQVCSAIIDRTAGQVHGDAVAVIEAISVAERQISAAIKNTQGA